MGARTFPGNPYDGHTLAAQIEQTTTLLQDLGVKPLTAIAELGYRGVDRLAPAQVVHRGRCKTMSRLQRRWLKRRQAAEPVIGHLKADNGMRRCWLKGEDGDAMNAVLCAAGFNLRWLLRATKARGLRAALVVLALMAALAWMFAPRWPSRRASTIVVA